MGADSSRLYSPTEESIDAYINRGGAHLVSRSQTLARRRVWLRETRAHLVNRTTSTTVDIVAGAGDLPRVCLSSWIF